jgi:hypothetical protein
LLGMVGIGVGSWASARPALAIRAARLANKCIFNIRQLLLIGLKAISKGASAYWSVVYEPIAGSFWTIDTMSPTIRDGKCKEAVRKGVVKNQGV